MSQLDGSAGMQGRKKAAFAARPLHGISRLSSYSCMIAHNMQLLLW
jgi:hypothetical protein